MKHSTCYAAALRLLDPKDYSDDPMDDAHAVARALLDIYDGAISEEIKKENDMQMLQIEVANSPDEAPNYNRDFVDVHAARITKVVIVNKGMESGKPTVDFQFESMDGDKFVALLTGDIVKALADAVLGVECR